MDSELLYEKIITDALIEDLGVLSLDGDVTTSATIPQDLMGKANCLIKGEGIIAGIAFAQKIIEFANKKFNVHLTKDDILSDGMKVNPGQIAFKLSGQVSAMLVLERLILNVMQRMSGIATETNRMMQMLEGTRCRLLDTRKTTPLVRILEKWAVEIGGGVNHRFGLYDMVLIKDNHIDACGGIIESIVRVEQYLKVRKLNLPIIIETRTLEEVKLVANHGGISRILLDNMSADMMREAVEIISGRYPTEASGNITYENIREKALSGVNFISTGALTHSYKSLDISLKIDKS